MRRPLTVLCSLTLALAAAAAPAQPPRPGAPEPAADAGRFAVGEYVGPATCATANCHGRGDAGEETDVLQNEYTTWVERDPHFRAHEVLFDERARIIARNLGTATPPTEDVHCLSCHALPVPRRLAGGRMTIEDGVSCEACHGPAGGWVDQHAQLEWSYADSVAAGMIDLRNPATRARVCHECHLGAADRQVGHELIAAGHPQLVFELDNYAEAMPSHWLSFVERAEYEPPPASPAAAWAVGQVAGFRDYLDHLAGRTAAGGWPEFAELSCDDCHHSLAEERWRRPRPAGARLGMPRWSPARWAVLRLAVEQRAPTRLPELAAGVDRLAVVVGDVRASPAAVAAAADALARQLDSVLPALRGGWSASALRSLMRSIAADRGYLETADRESAEQAALAIQSLYSSLVAVAPSQARGPVSVTIDELFDALQDRYAYRPERFVEILARLEDQLR